jgi:HlyD family secretion protein
MARRRTTLGAAGVAAGLVVLLVYWLTRPDAVPVRLATIGRGLVESTVANTRAGTVKACQRARISPAVGGRIDALPVHEGDRVEAGQLLLELWNDDLEARLELAEREHASAVANGEQACVRADVAEEEATRQVALHRQGIASDEGMRRMVAEAKAGRAGCRAAGETARVAEAQIAVTRAALAQTRLRAPFAGIVAEINGELGEFVTPSPVGIPTLPTVDLIDPTCPYVSAPIDEVDAGGIRPAMLARISLDAFGDRAFMGRVRRVAPYVLDLEAQARTVDVEVDFTVAGDTGALLVGYSADIEIVLDTRDNVVRVPTEALLEAHRVLVYAGGTLEERDVEPGLSNWRYTEVRSGLREGERVVLSVDREGVEAGARAEPDGGAEPS